MVNEEPSRSLLWPAVLVGIGVAGSLDEIVLHQLLRWHHFYDRASQAAGLIADGTRSGPGRPTTFPTTWYSSPSQRWCSWPDFSCSGRPVRRQRRQEGPFVTGEAGDQHGQEAR